MNASASTIAGARLRALRIEHPFPADARTREVFADGADGDARGA